MCALCIWWNWDPSCDWLSELTAVAVVLGMAAGRGGWVGRSSSWGSNHAVFRDHLKWIGEGSSHPLLELQEILLKWQRYCSVRSDLICNCFWNYWQFIQFMLQVQLWSIHSQCSGGLVVSMDTSTHWHGYKCYDVRDAIWYVCAYTSRAIPFMNSHNSLQANWTTKAKDK